MGHTTVTPRPHVQILMVHLIVIVMLDTLEMVSHARVSTRLYYYLCDMHLSVLLMYDMHWSVLCMHDMHWSALVYKQALVCECHMPVHVC